MIHSLIKDDAEYYMLAKTYNTYNPKKREKAESETVVINGVEFKSGPPPCYTMGNSLTPKEIKVINERIDNLIQTKVLLKEE